MRRLPPAVARRRENGPRNRRSRAPKGLETASHELLRTLEFVSLVLGEKEGKTVNFKKLLSDAWSDSVHILAPCWLYLAIELGLN